MLPRFSLVSQKTQPSFAASGVIYALLFQKQGHLELLPEAHAATLKQSFEIQIQEGSSEQWFFPLKKPSASKSKAKGDVVVLAGLGQERIHGLGGFRKMMAAQLKVIFNQAETNKTKTVRVAWDESCADVSLEEQLWHATSVAAEMLYRFNSYKSSEGKQAPAPYAPAVIEWQVKNTSTALAQTVSDAATVAQAQWLARDLGNTPANVCTPRYLAQTARDLSKKRPIRVSVLSRTEMQKLGMGALLAVAQGSQEPPQFIIMEYRGGKKKPINQQPIVLVGKGVTFDSGGISIKPAGGMEDMKFDMSGAGSVIATLQACADLQLPLHVVGLVPTTENMPSGTATRPGDVVKSMSGQTIEINNTDAEGRLILCDALTYAKRFNPECVIDIATLTGACVVALGQINSALYANQEALRARLLECGQQMWDRTWPMPLGPEYHEQIKGTYGDINNTGGRFGGSITAACFLQKFAEYPWAHLDIAGVAYGVGEIKGSTGRPVPMLVQFLRQRAQSARALPQEYLSIRGEPILPNNKNSAAKKKLKASARQ